MTRRLVASLIAAVGVTTGVFAAAPDALEGGNFDFLQVLVVVLSLSLAVALSALVSVITVLLRARRAKARSDEVVVRLSSAVHQTADAVFVTDRSGVIEYVNPAFELITGYSSAEVLGRTPRILNSGEQSADYYERLWRTVLGGRSFHGTPVNRKCDGQLFHAEQTITPMTNGDGEISHFVSVMRDMTDRRLIEGQEVEMRLAASIQRKLLPLNPPRLPGWDLAGAVRPALATCGDYFDFITVRDDKLCLVVADACGHGVGPALIAVQTRAHLRSLLNTDLGLEEALSQLNEILLADLDLGLFVTLTMVCIDVPTGSLAWASAGHPTAYVFGADGKVTKELGSTGLPLGMLAGRPRASEGGAGMRCGDVLLMITDGILETQSPDGAEFGDERVCQVVGAIVDRPASEIVRRLHDAVRVFAGDQLQADDLTAVVCRRTTLD